MAQKTLTRARMYLLGVSLTMLLILGVKSPENPNFWGVNRRFQAKRAKYWKFRNYCIDFNQILHNDRDHQVVVVGGPKKSKMADGRHFEKNPVKSLYLCNRLTDLDKIWYNDAYSPLTAGLWLKFRIFENSSWRQPPCWKSQKNRDLSATVWPICTKCGTLMQNGSLNRSYR